MDEHQEDRRALNEEYMARFDGLESNVNDIRKRVYNGMAQELRKEVSDEMKSVKGSFGAQLKRINTLVMGIFIALFLSLTGIVIEGRYTSIQSSEENTRNYKAIVDLGSKLQLHLEETNKERINGKN